jgi:hypothetical protein
VGLDTHRLEVRICSFINIYYIWCLFVTMVKYWLHRSISFIDKFAREYFDIASRGEANNIATAFAPYLIHLPKVMKTCLPVRASRSCALKQNRLFLKWSYGKMWLPLLRSGFAESVLHTLRLAPDAVITLGPPCSSFVWVNSHTSQWNSQNPYGDEKKDYIRLANLKLGFYLFTVVK